MDDASAHPRAGGKPGLTEAERQLVHRRGTLELTRTRILGELRTTCNERFRAQLERELTHLNEEIQRLGS